MVGLLLLAGAMVLGAADCRTPLGIPCSTIRSQVTQWQLFRDGPLDFKRFSEVRTYAVRGDGSFVDIAGAATSLYLAPENRVIRFDHGAKTISRRAPLIWHDRPNRYSSPGDRTCVSGIRHWGVHFFLRGQERVAGVPVIKWIGSNAGGGYTEVYLAPSLDCRPLKIRTVIRKFGVFPVFVSTTEAVSVELGEPKAELFAVPSGYREVEEPR